MSTRNPISWSHPVFKVEILNSISLSLHVLAHLRAVAESIPPLQAARRYLNVDDAAGEAHRAAVAAAALVAQRAGLPYRLLRITLSVAKLGVQLVFSGEAKTRWP